MIRASRTCEAYGELWQQIGGPIVDPGLDGTSTGQDKPGCATVDLTQLVVWWEALRSIHPFFTVADDTLLKKLI